MDELDLRILAVTGFVLWGRQATSFEALGTSHIAEAVDRSPETVRRRLRAMEAEGVIRGYSISPSFDHLGLHGEALFFDLGPEDPPLDELRLVDGVGAATDFVGPETLVVLGYQGEAERARRLEVVQERLGGSDPRTVARHERSKPERELTGLDWRILRALRRDAKRSPSEVADQVGVTARTVRRRRRRMAEEGALYVAPRVAVEEIKGAVPFDLLVEHAPDQGAAVRNRLADAFGERLLSVPDRWPLEGPRLDLFLYAPSMAEVDRMRDRAQDVDGVEEATSLITKRTMRTDWVDALVDARAEAAGADAS